jgi:hypothetical protein
LIHFSPSLSLRTRYIKNLRLMRFTFNVCLCIYRRSRDECLKWYGSFMLQRLR